MEILPGVDLKSWLVGLKGNTISYSCTKHHLGALHKVEHAILQLGHERLLVDLIEVDFLIGGNLDSNVASNEVDLTSHVVEFVVKLPETCLFVDFEEKD